MPDYRVTGKTKALQEFMVGMLDGLESATSVKQTFEEIVGDWTGNERRMLHCLQICRHLDCSDLRDRLCAPAKVIGRFDDSDS